jgi:predicted kinase
MLEFMLYLNTLSRQQREISFCFLDTPLSECLRRINERNGGRPINERIVASKHRTIARHAEYYRAGGIRSELLSTAGSKQEVLDRFVRLYSLSESFNCVKGTKT